jgi:hypothetical protein
MTEAKLATGLRKLVEEDPTFRHGSRADDRRAGRARPLAAPPWSALHAIGSSSASHVEVTTQGSP